MFPVLVQSPKPQASSLKPARPEVIAFPSWNRSAPAWFLRRISLPTWILPLGYIFMELKIEGLEHLRTIDGPVIFAANHQSHLDTPAIMMALPAKWRYRLAPAMAKEFFKAHFNPQQYSRREWFTNSLNYYLSSEFFNAFPLPQREAGTRQTLRYIGEVLGDGYSVLIFPEGKRTMTGDIGRFMPGVGMIGARLVGACRAGPAGGTRNRAPPEDEISGARARACGIWRANQTRRRGLCFARRPGGAGSQKSLRPSQNRA